MRLITLGGLTVDGAAYRREKPLLLLAYLALEGSKLRRHLADLFWPDAANPMNSLAQNLIRLRPLGSVVRENTKWIEPQIQCDAYDFRSLCRTGRLHDATQLYRGAFLDGVDEGLNPDLEEWLLDTRAVLGAEARAAHLTLADQYSLRMERDLATEHAELAYTTPGANLVDPEEILRLWRVLGRTDHPLALALRRDAGDLGLALPNVPAVQPAPLRLIGRRPDLELLRDLTPGQVAWISGPPGMGKTALLEALASHDGWRVLPGIDNLPLSTLEPLTASPMTSAADALNVFRDPALKVAIDGWEDCDATTRAALTLVARQRPGATLVIAARQSPAIRVDQHLPLYPISEAELLDHPGAFAATGGHPVLLAGFLHGTPAIHSLQAHLNHLGKPFRRLFLALAAQDSPNLRVTRSALGWSAQQFAETLDRLTDEGLTTPHGLIRASTPARNLLEALPLERSLLHLHLARAHPAEHAWPHWLRAKDLWEAGDRDACASAAYRYAEQEMKRGYPAKAAKTLAEAPQTDIVKALQGWALLRCGDLLKSLEVLKEVKHDSMDIKVCRSRAMIKLSQYDEALRIANEIVVTDAKCAAVVHFIHGSIAFRKGDMASALKMLERAASEFYSLGNKSEMIECKVITSIINYRVGGSIDVSFAEVLSLAPEYSIYRANALQNYALSLAQKGAAFEAEKYFDESCQIYDILENKYDYATVLTAHGVLCHSLGRTGDASEKYIKAIGLLEGVGDHELLSTINDNLNGMSDQRSLEDNLRSLVEKSHPDIAAIIVANSEVANLKY